MRVDDFDPSRGIVDLGGKVFFVTGGTSGIGRETVLELAKHNPRHVVFTGRNVTGAQEVIQAAGADGDRLSFLPCNLTSLASVRNAFQAFTSGPYGDRLDVLLTNAGIAGPPYVPTELTKEGYEPRFGVNHVAHALLIQLLLPQR